MEGELDRSRAATERLGTAALSGAARRAWLPYAAFGTLLVALAYAAGGGMLVTRASPIVAFVGAGGILAGCAINRPPLAVGWATVAVGVLLLGIGDLLWAVSGPPTIAGSSVPIAVDVAYVVGYVVLIAGLFRLGGARSRDIATTIDVGIVALGLALVIWLALVERVFEVPAGRLYEGWQIPTAYAVTGVALAVVLIRTIFRPSRSTVSIRLVELALVAFLASDVLYIRAAIDGTWSTGSPIDIGWFAAYLLWGAASLHPSSAQPVSEPDASNFSFGRATSLVTACLVVPAALLWAWRFGDLRDLPVIAAVSASLSLLWTARVYVSLRRLQRSLDERRALEGRLRDQAMHDPLVGLLNRSSFEQLLEDVSAAEIPLAVLYLDLDDFKDVNDTFGHAAGDEALVQVARRIAGVLRADDKAARLGGDEFAVLLRGAQQAAAEAVARRILDALNRPFTVEGRPVHLHASIGIGIGAPQKPPRELMREADVAMYLAKGQGNSRYQVFEKSMHAAVMERISLRAELEQAIANRELVLHYQPIVTISRREVFACEALVRWRHPTRGLLLPAEFIDLAEDTGLVVQLGQWVIEEACREAVRWTAALGDAAPAVTVNVSPVQFHHPAFLEDLAGAVARTGVDPRQVILEVTESTLLDGDDAMATLPELRAMGFRIALDDFGTGYSSLAYLARYPIDLLKIDRAFVAALGTGARDDRLAAAIVNLSHDLRIQVIAEGVETEEQLGRLAELGCAWIQGWLVAAAMPSPEIEQLLRIWSSRAAADLEAAS